MTIAELIKDIFQSNKEKLKYPIFYTYLIIILLWNWDVLSYYLISDSSIEEKIECIKLNYSGWHRIYYPLIYSIFISLLFPYLMFFLEWCLQLSNKKRKKIRYESNKLIREEKLQIARNEFFVEQEKTGKRDLEQLNQQIYEANSRLEIERTQNENSLKFMEETIEKQKLLIQDRETANSKLSKDLKNFHDLHDNLIESNSALIEEKQKILDEYEFSSDRLDAMIKKITGFRVGVNISRQALSVILENIFVQGLFDQSKLTTNIITDLKDNLNMRIDNNQVYEILRFFEENKLISFLDYKKQLTTLGLEIYNYINNEDFFDEDPPF